MTSLEFQFRDPEDLNVHFGEVVENVYKCQLSDDESMNFLREILISKVYDIVIETPLQKADWLTYRTGINFYMKREDQQPSVN